MSTTHEMSGLFYYLGGMDEPKQVYFTAQQVAEMSSLSVHTIYAEIKSGRLKSVKFGKIIRIKREDALTFFSRAFK